MKAVRLHEFGGPEVLRFEDVPDPKPRKDQVLVSIRACSLNHLDIWVRKGLPGVKLPHILGSDIAGEIVGIGRVRDRFHDRTTRIARSHDFLQSLREVRRRIAKPVPGVRGAWQHRGRRQL